MSEKIKQLSKLSTYELNDVLGKLKVGNVKKREANKHKAVKLSKLLSMKIGKEEEFKGGPLTGGNLADMNLVFWPFLFQSPVVRIDSQTTQNANVNITQEAAFVVTKMSRVIHTLTDNVSPDVSHAYVNPNNNAIGGEATGLRFTIIDSQSRRTWFDESADIDFLGHAQEPTCIPPYMVLPNQNLEVRWINESTTEDFKASVLFHGFRVRMEDAENILSLVTAD